jgi:hypothetical protein
MTFTSTSTIYVAPTEPTETVQTYGLLKRSAKFLSQRAEWCSNFDMPCRLVVYKESVIEAACKTYLGGGDEDVVTVTKHVHGPTVTETAYPSTCTTSEDPEYAEPAGYEGDDHEDEGEWSGEGDDHEDEGEWSGEGDYHEEWSGEGDDGEEYSDDVGEEAYAAPSLTPENEDNENQGYEASPDKPHVVYDSTSEGYTAPTPSVYDVAQPYVPYATPASYASAGEYAAPMMTAKTKDTQLPPALPQSTTRLRAMFHTRHPQATTQLLNMPPLRRHLHTTTHTTDSNGLHRRLLLHTVKTIHLTTAPTAQL